MPGTGCEAPLSARTPTPPGALIGSSTAVAVGWFTNSSRHVPVTVVFWAFPGLWRSKFADPLKSFVDFVTGAHEPVGSHATDAVTVILNVEKERR